MGLIPISKNNLTNRFLFGDVASPADPNIQEYVSLPPPEARGLSPYPQFRAKILGASHEDACTTKYSGMFFNVKLPEI